MRTIGLLGGTRNSFQKMIMQKVYNLDSIPDEHMDDPEFKSLMMTKHGSPFANMNSTLRAPTAVDYEAIASWIPDATACARWAGAQLRFPFVGAELPQLLAVPGASSFCLSEGSGKPLGFGQFWVKAAGSVHLGRIIVSPHERGRGLGKILCELLVAEARRRTGAGPSLFECTRTTPPPSRSTRPWASWWSSPSPRTRSSP